MSAPSLPALRCRLAADYAARRKAHRARAGIAQQLKRATTRQLEIEVASARREAERAARAARAAQQPSLLADLDRLIT